MCVCVHVLFITHILIILVFKHMLTRTKHYCLSAVSKEDCIILLTRSRSHKRISSPSIINSPLNLGDGEVSQRNIHLAPTSLNINIRVRVVVEPGTWQWRKVSQTLDTLRFVQSWLPRCCNISWHRSDILRNTYYTIILFLSETSEASQTEKIIVSGTLYYTLHLTRHVMIYSVRINSDTNL